jgi:hypothetical protein
VGPVLELVLVFVMDWGADECRLSSKCHAVIYKIATGQLISIIASHHWRYWLTKRANRGC